MKPIVEETPDDVVVTGVIKMQPLLNMTVSKTVNDDDVSDFLSEF